MKGQLESSFQWIFVLIAGAIFFGLFLFLMRGCTDAGSARAQGLGISLAASRLETGAWQGTSVANRTIQEADVACIAGGSLVLSSGTQAATIDRAPVFLPSRLGGRLDVVTSGVRLERGDALIRLSNVLYGYDEDTYYFAVPGTVALAGRNVEELGAEADVPGSARAAVLVSDGSIDPANVDISGIPDAVRVTGVTLQDGQALFYTRAGDRLVPGTRLRYETGALALGAAVSGDPALYMCGKTGLATRLRYVTWIYQSRVSALKSATPACAMLLGQAETLLRDINTQQGDEEYLAALFGNEQRITSLQAALRAASCPVIA